MSREIEFEQDTSRTEVADQMESLAEQLREDGPFDITLGDRTVTLDPPATVEFEIEIEDEGDVIGDDVERSLELELEWDTREGEAELPE